MREFSITASIPGKGIVTRTVRAESAEKAEEALTASEPGAVVITISTKTDA